MLKLLILGSFFISSAFAGTVILEKLAVSGFTVPEHSFVKKCSFLNTGYMESTIVNGDGTAIGMAKQIPKRKLEWIKVLLAKAKSGIVEVRPYPCDVGSTILKGWVDGTEVELDIAQDCGDRRVNNSPTVEFLQNISESICGF